MSKEIGIYPDFKRRKPSMLRVMSSRWALKLMNAIVARDKGARGEFVKVAIGDTGINKVHPSLPKDCEIFIGASHEHPFDENGHGSNCLSIFFSIPDKAKFLVGKIADKHGNGSFAEMAGLITHAADQGCRVISLSLGARPTDYSKRVDDAIRYAWGKGCIVVAASGNEGTAVGFPANHELVLAVGAIDKNGVVASFQNFGMKLDWVAPGVDILGASVGTGDMIASGTSQACPFVAGMLTILIGEYYAKNGVFPDPLEAIRLLKLNSKDLYAKGFDTKTGYGLPYALGTDNAFKYDGEVTPEPEIVCNDGWFKKLIKSLWA